MGKLLRNRGIFGRSLNRLAVRCHHFGCGSAPDTRPGAGRRRICDPDHRSFRKCAVALSSVERSWHDTRGASLLWGLLGLCGLVYTIIVARRLRVTAYRPVFEDWLFHALLPFAAYAMLSASACLARAHAHRAMFGVAGAALMLLFSGIHNAWDAVTYHVFVKKREHDESRSRS